MVWDCIQLLSMAPTVGYSHCRLYYYSWAPIDPPESVLFLNLSGKAANSCVMFAKIGYNTPVWCCSSLVPILGCVSKLLHPAMTAMKTAIFLSYSTISKRFVGRVPSCRRIYSNFPISNNDKQLHLSHPNVVVRLTEESRTGALILAMRWVEDDLR